MYFNKVEFIFFVKFILNLNNNILSNIFNIYYYYRIIKKKNKNNHEMSKLSSKLQHIVKRILTQFEKHQDKTFAEGMVKYMKNAWLSHGIRAPKIQ